MFRCYRWSSRLELACNARKGSRVGKREAEQGTVAIRTLGEERQRVVPLVEATALLRTEATPPDLRRAQSAPLDP